MTNEEKEIIIAQALDTEEGRVALGNALWGYRPMSIDYQSPIGRKLVYLEESPVYRVGRCSNIDLSTDL